MRFDDLDKWLRWRQHLAEAATLALIWGTGVAVFFLVYATTVNP